MQPFCDGVVTPERPTTVEIPCIIRVPFIGTHTIFLGEMTNDREEFSKILQFICCLESRFTQLPNIEPRVLQLTGSTHTVSA